MTEAFVTWEPLPAFRKGYWRCAKCDQKMKLLPVSHDIPADRWACSCREISFAQRDLIFKGVAEDIKKQLKLKQLDWITDEYSWNGFKYQNHFSIISDEWDGTSRLGARRKVITPVMRNEILNILQEDLQEALDISFQKVENYFIE